ncbi:hypothetical protein D3C87_1564430 [compost metagenome]
MQDGFFALRGAEQAAGAAVIGLALFTHHIAATDGAFARHTEVRDIHLARRISVTRFDGHPINRNDFRSVGECRHDTHYLGNYIARTAHYHLVAYSHTFFANLEQVVQRGIRDGDAPHKYRHQPRHGGDLACTPHLHVDALDLGDHLLRGILVGHGPARLAGLEAQVALQLQRVDLVDHSINVVRQRIAAGAHLLVKRY